MSSRRPREAGLFEAAPARRLRTFLWRADDPNEDRLVYRLEYQRLGEESWRPVGDETEDTVQSWDTSGVPDGLYVVRLTACDRQDNPRAEALCSSLLSAPLRVDTTPPEIRDFRVERTETGLRIRCEARDAGGPVSEAWLELPDGSIERLDPRDGICDSVRESFERELRFPHDGAAAPPEPWRVRVEIADRMGNVAAEEGEVR
jgi:hypothetical protein